MKRWIAIILLLLLGWLATGFFVVEGNQQAVVRRFGRVLRTPAGAVKFHRSGLHYDLPWPFAQVDRVNLNEVRTLSIGLAETRDVDGSEFLQSVESSRRSQFLTGDKNVLNLQVRIQYRISESGVEDFLFGSRKPERRLQLIAEAAAADLVGRSGVDFVHPLGLSELRALLTERTRELAERHDLGVAVEEVAINSVYPPARVKADFLDVSNARADKDKYINAARSYAEQTLATARAEAQKVRDKARADAHQLVESARGRADSFRTVIAQFQRDSENGIHSREAARDMALRRRYIETMEEILSNVAGKVLLDSGKAVDLTIFQDPEE